METDRTETSSSGRSGGRLAPCPICRQEIRRFKIPPYASARTASSCSRSTLYSESLAASIHHARWQSRRTSRLLPDPPAPTARRIHRYRQGDDRPHAAGDSQPAERPAASDVSYGRPNGGAPKLRRFGRPAHGSYKGAERRKEIFRGKASPLSYLTDQRGACDAWLTRSRARMSATASMRKTRSAR